MTDDSNRLSSQALAELIIDALVEAGIVKKSEFDEAVAICREEIETRKALGDF